MTMKEWLKQRIKKLFENTESTLTNIFLLALLGGSATVLAVSKKALSVFIQLINTPTPLWATISLLLLVYLYIRIIVRKRHSSSATSSTVLDETKNNILKLLFSQNMSTAQLSASLGLQLQTAAYHLEELANLNMVILQRFSQQLPGGGGPFDLPSLRKYSAWTLKQPGRKYLLDNKFEET